MRESRSLALAVAVALMAAVAGAAVMLVGLLRDPSSTPGARSASPKADVTTSPPTPPPSPTQRTGCDVAGPFRPTRVTTDSIRAAVVALPRDANNVPSTPPLDTAGKQMFAWDLGQGIRPGDPRGNTLFNAHTWPDGTALGNRLLETLDEGDRIVVRGEGARLCYRVVDEVEVLATQGSDRYYRRTGPHQMAIVVCSGRRLGPGEWEKRTIWFAEPSL